MNFTQLETDRLIIREVKITDVNDLFEMDSNPNVHKYIERKPLKTIEEEEKVVNILQNQYKQNGIGRWALELKKTGEVIGWAGFKFYSESLNSHKNFYELGYRLKEKHWGKGYTTEACKKILEYGFNEFSLTFACALIDERNTASKNVAQKLGFKYINTFIYNEIPVFWYEIKAKAQGNI